MAALVTPTPDTSAADTSIAQPIASPTAMPVTTSAYTTDDKEIARLIKAGADEAIPQLKLLNEMDPQERTDLFLPLLAWINGQRAGLEGHEPSSCTSAAVALFFEGLDRYDDMRARFLKWRDWGAHRDPFAKGAPAQAVATFTEALVELDATCPA
jgi:hypothetical protein